MKRCMLSQCKDAIDNPAALLRANEAARIERLGAFTPDADEVNKSSYSRIVGCLNILSLLASFARDIRYTTDVNLRHGGGLLQAAPVSLLNVFLFL